MRTITSKLTRIYLIVAISVLLSSGLISLLYLYLHARAVAHENLSTQAVALAGNLESSVAFGDATFAQQTLDALAHYQQVRMAAVIMPDGGYFARYRTRHAASESDVLKQTLTQGDFIEATQHGVVFPIARQLDAPAHLVIVASLSQLNQETLLVLMASTGIGVILLLASYTLFRKMSHRVTRPIEDLAAVMRTVERDGDHGQRAKIVSDDEIGELTKGFNAMLSALEKQNRSLNLELDERRAVEAKLDRLAHYDTVTHLPNRYYFHERLKIAVAHSAQMEKLMAVIFVDLDNFKLVNDSYGHHVGDKQLLAVAERLSMSLRSGDVVCRLGGDEFAIILEHLPDTKQIDLICAKLMLNLTQPLRIDNYDIVVTGSMGVAVCPGDSDNPESLLRFADSAMYAAKGAGKNTWRRFDPEMATQSALRLTLESQMRVALAEQQFELHYQPQINMATGQVYGVEALARWNHPERGYISPAQFIPVAEESGLIRPLGEWVLRTACQQILAWSKEGHTQLTVAVNVSVRQLAHPDFVEQVIDILTQTGCRPEQLEIEITESILMQHSGKARAMLENLHAYGIGIAIDDFGTGYSSMAQLKNMPVSRLKIDKSFVDDIISDKSDQAITAAISSLAHSLHIETIAEGVENLEQVMMLRRAGCHEFQGYHFSRPLPASKVSDFISGFGLEQEL